MSLRIVNSRSVIRLSDATGSPTVGNQGNEADLLTKGNDELSVELSDELQLLRVGRTDGDDHSPGVAELREQSEREIGGGGGDKDRVEGSDGRKTEGAVSGEDADAGVAECGENFAGAIGKGWVAFDGENLRSKFGEQSGNVAGTSTDFEDLFSGCELEAFEHQGDDIGLRDGLAVADGQRMIFVGLGAVRLRDELVAGHAHHGAEDARVGDAPAPELRIDHELTCCGRVGHGLGRGYFLRRRMRRSKLTTPFWSRVPTTETLRLK
jgi:hypothetical protein